MATHPLGPKIARYPYHNYLCLRSLLLGILLGIGFLSWLVIGIFEMPSLSEGAVKLFYSVLFWLFVLVQFGWMFLASILISEFWVGDRWIMLYRDGLVYPDEKNIMRYRALERLSINNDEDGRYLIFYYKDHCILIHEKGLPPRTFDKVVRAIYWGRGEESPSMAPQQSAIE